MSVSAERGIEIVILILKLDKVDLKGGLERWQKTLSSYWFSDIHNAWDISQKSEQNFNVSGSSSGVSGTQEPWGPGWWAWDVLSVMGYSGQVTWSKDLWVLALKAQCNLPLKFPGDDPKPSTGTGVIFQCWWLWWWWFIYDRSCLYVCLSRFCLFHFLISFLDTFQKCL